MILCTLVIKKFIVTTAFQKKYIIVTCDFLKSLNWVKKVISTTKFCTEGSEKMPQLNQTIYSHTYYQPRVISTLMSPIPCQCHLARQWWTIKHVEIVWVPFFFFLFQWEQHEGRVDKETQHLKWESSEERKK